MGILDRAHLLSLLTLALGCARSQGPSPSPVPASGTEQAPPALLSVAAPSVHARLLIGEDRAQWIDVHVAGSDEAAFSRCDDTLAMLVDTWKRAENPTQVARACGVEDLPGVLAGSGEPMVLVQPSQDPALDLMLHKAMRGNLSAPSDTATADAEPATTVVTYHARFASAAKCREVLAQLEVQHEESERRGAASADEFLSAQLADLTKRLEASCAGARASAERCKSSPKRDRPFCEIDVEHQERACSNEERLRAVLEERRKVPPEKTPFAGRCVAWREVR